MRFTRQQHLRTAAEFESVRASGAHRECGFFYMGLAELPGRVPPVRRAGFIASRRVGGAVQRNRAKRLMREVFRLHQESLPASCDLVMVARRSINGASLQDLERRFAGALKKVKGPGA
jgi:ribonuclease P protein component